MVFRPGKTFSKPVGFTATLRRGFVSSTCAPCRRAFKDTVFNILIDPLNLTCPSCNKPLVIRLRLLDHTLPIPPTTQRTEIPYEQATAK